MSARVLTQDERNTIESLIDSSSLANVVDALTTICYEKADHIDSNWQDHGLARMWTKAGKSIEKAIVPALEVSK